MWTRDRIAKFVGIAAAFLGLALGASFAGAGFGADYGARDPVRCVPLTQAGPPDPEQAAFLVRCAHEVERGGGLYLMKDLVIRIGKGRPYDLLDDTSVSEVDMSVDVFPLRGSFTWSECGRQENAISLGKNPDRYCTEADIPNATGACWFNLFGEWQCTLGGRREGPVRDNMPPVTD